MQWRIVVPSEFSLQPRPRPQGHHVAQLQEVHSVDCDVSGAPWSCSGPCLCCHIQRFGPPPSFFESASDPVGRRCSRWVLIQHPFSNLASYLSKSCIILLRTPCPPSWSQWATNYGTGAPPPLHSVSVSGGADLSCPPPSGLLQCEKSIVQMD